MIRTVAIGLCLILLAAFMWGLSYLFHHMDEHFAEGAMFATFLLVGLVWLHVRFVGPIN